MQIIIDDVNKVSVDNRGFTVVTEDGETHKINIIFSEDSDKNIVIKNLIKDC